jgi:hypothetical protein
MRVILTKEHILPNNIWYNNIASNVWYKLFFKPEKGKGWLSYSAYTTRESAMEAAEKAEKKWST